MYKIKNLKYKIRGLTKRNRLLKRAAVHELKHNLILKYFYRITVRLRSVRKTNSFFHCERKITARSNQCGPFQETATVHTLALLPLVECRVLHAAQFG